MLGLREQRTNLEFARDGSSGPERSGERSSPQEEGSAWQAGSTITIEMADTVPPKRRSEIMSGIRSKGMKPEMTVRRQLHSMGYRYRLHRRELPGKPDLGVPGPTKGHFRARLFLASACGPQMQNRPTAQIQS